jgi:hypothetical protein
MSNFTFNPALPLPISFKIQETKYGNQLNLFIPTESITHFIDHLQKLVDTKTTEGKVYLGKEKGELKTEGIYINAKANENEYGIYGQINPQKINTGVNEELPF